MKKEEVLEGKSQEVSAHVKDEKMFISRLKHDNKNLKVRVENLELQIKFYNYSEQLNSILANFQKMEADRNTSDLVKEDAVTNEGSDDPHEKPELERVDEVKENN